MSGEGSEVVGVARDDDGAGERRRDGHVRIDDVRGRRLRQQSTNRVGLGGFERDDVAPAKESPQLYLFGTATGLGHHWGSRYWDYASFKPGAMLGPDLTIVAVGCDQHAGVVDDGHADRLRGVTSSSATRCRAMAISSGVNAPWRRSHSATAASPSRTTSARRAASVIQADTLIPSSAAALTTRS
jgi:hypothetical protein